MEDLPIIERHFGIPVLNEPSNGGPLLPEDLAFVNKVIDKYGAVILTRSVKFEQILDDLDEAGLLPSSPAESSTVQGERT